MIKSATDEPRAAGAYAKGSYARVDGLEMYSRSTGAVDRWSGFMVA